MNDGTATASVLEYISCYLIVHVVGRSDASTVSEQNWQQLTDTVSMGVLSEPADALLLGAAQEGSHSVLTHQARPTVVGSKNTLINI